MIAAKFTRGSMNKLMYLSAALILAVPLPAQVLRFADLNTRDFAKLDRQKTVVVLPGGILEEHGPYLPAGTDGIFNAKLAEDLDTAHRVATRLDGTCNAARSIGRRCSQ